MPTNGQVTLKVPKMDKTNQPLQNKMQTKRSLNATRRKSEVEIWKQPKTLPLVGNATNFDKPSNFRVKTAADAEVV